LEINSFYYLHRLVKMDAESQLEATRLFNEIEKFMKESIATFITTGVTDESRQPFLDTANAVGATAMWNCTRSPTTSTLHHTDNCRVTIPLLHR